MRTSKVKNIALLTAVIVFGICAFAQAVSFTIGSGNYYVSVGDHDYLPYAYNSYPGGYQSPALSFQSVMADYGTWVSLQPFGNVWRPYVAAGWRPFTQGHWAYTQYGPTWQGYEPWSWASDHYGNWVFSQQMGWVWIPGYDYSPGRVAWAQGYNSLGWMPLPPTGYDYSRGYLANIGPMNQFTYNDSDFSIGFGVGNDGYYYNGGPYYDPRYRNLYYNPSYLNIATNLWTFLDPNNFGADNYSDYYYGGDLARDLFDQRLLRITTRPLDRVVVERITRQPVQVETVRVNQVQIDGRPVRLVAVQGEEAKIQKNANRVIREEVAPAFAEKGRTFKAKESRVQTALDKAFHQEGGEQQVQTVNSDEMVREAHRAQQQREQHRAQMKDTKREEVARVVKEGKVREKNNPGQLKKEEDTRTRGSSVTPITPAPENEPNTRRNRPENPNQPGQQPEEQNRKNRPNDQVTPEEQQRIDQEQERRMRNEHSNRLPDTDENSNRRNEPNANSNRDNPDQEPNVKSDQENPDSNEANVKSDQENPDRNVKTNDQQNKSDNNKKAKSNKKPKKDKDKNNNPDQPPQD